jgi:hypothetical protein
MAPLFELIGRFRPIAIESWRLMMTKFQTSCLSTPFAVLMLSQAVFGQNSLDLNEADTREIAYKFMSAAEERFNCEIEEHSMREVGARSSIRYLFHLKAEGDECDDALIFLTNMAAREDKLVFRQLESVDEQTGEPLILYDQVLIHEVNPEIEDKKATEE